jgi:hypothetical protein
VHDDLFAIPPWRWIPAHRGRPRCLLRLSATAGQFVAVVFALVLLSAAPAGAVKPLGHPLGLPSVTSLSPQFGIEPLLGLLGPLPATRASTGYRLASTAGEVGTYGGSSYLGSLSRTNLNAPVVGIATTPDGQGYWLAGADGGIFAFGNARFYGSIGSAPLNAPVVGIAATPDGKGYWLVGADGGIFAFGDARFYGSMGTTNLNAPVVGIAATPDGLGYWLVGADGGIFAFGDARFYGSMGSAPLNAPIVGIATTSDGQGYWLAGSDGGIFAFGDAPFGGAASGYVPEAETITALSAVLSNNENKSASEVGDFTTPVVHSVSPYVHGASGFDVSYPQCREVYPTQSSVAVVGANHGSAFTVNPCFSREANWANPNLTVYINLNSPQGADSTQWEQGPAGSCDLGNVDCESYNYGFNAAQSSVSYVRSAGYSPRTWWLDIETSNYWSSDFSANDRVIAGALAAIGSDGDFVGVYSTNYQWHKIAGFDVPNVPVWYATGAATLTPQSWCSETSFAGGPIDLVQSGVGSFDGDYAC